MQLNQRQTGNNRRKISNNQKGTAELSTQEVEKHGRNYVGWKKEGGMEGIQKRCDIKEKMTKAPTHL